MEKAWITFWVMLSILSICITGERIYEDNVIARMVEAGVNPIDAQCAIKPSSHGCPVNK
jgi:hypothetical protein